jgi:hypothetical protein
LSFLSIFTLSLLTFLNLVQMDIILNRLGPSVPANERPAFYSPQAPEGIDKEILQSSAAPPTGFDSAKLAKSNPLTKVCSKRASSDKRKSPSIRVNKDEISAQSRSLASPSNNTPLKTPTVSLGHASASPHLQDNIREAAVKAGEVQQAGESTVQVLLGPLVGDVACHDGESDNDSSGGCCLLQRSCFFRRSGPDNSFDSDSNGSASKGLVEGTARASAVTVAQPLKGALVAVEDGDDKDTGEPGERTEGCCALADQGENNMGCTGISMDNRTDSITYLAHSASCEAASESGARDGLVRAPDKDFPLTSVVAVAPDLAGESARDMIVQLEPAPADAFAYQDAAMITKATAVSAQRQATLDLAPTSVAAVSDTGTETIQLGGGMDAHADGKMAEQQYWDFGRSGFGQLLIDLRQVIAVGACLSMPTY